MYTTCCHSPMSICPTDNFPTGLGNHFIRRYCSSCTQVGRRSLNKSVLSSTSGILAKLWCIYDAIENKNLIGASMVGVSLNEPRANETALPKCIFLYVCFHTPEVLLHRNLPKIGPPFFWVVVKSQKYAHLFMLQKHCRITSSSCLLLIVR